MLLQCPLWVAVCLIWECNSLLKKLKDKIYNLSYEDGTSEKFQASKWKEKLKNEKFRNRVMQLMDEEIIMRFEKKQGRAEDFYDFDGDEVPET